ncbi:type II secretion system F family protein [Gynuella sunshinyii]|uniref:Type II secretory pathway, component PulF n=1 Tax=Gynuella sunshinyii YC6258 TaxID=1445510 RepID=A0A0C5VM58_9GAMM|nr:type II secretion system F family protein [Gynuella sunshinyii]AJQ94443.1 type II secretory pathway, component PulF [Gynuella sunshinyii YC6258]
MATAAKTFTYKYEGISRSGRSVKGELSAVNPAIAKAQLRKQGINVKKMVKKSQSLSFLGSGKKSIKSEDIAVFTRQMATMMKAGVPLVQAFDIVAEGLSNKSMAELVTAMKADVSAGGTFGSALRKHPKYFDDLFCSLVESGEQAGALETMLDRVAIYKEKSESIKRKVKSALKYPITVIVVAMIVTAVLLLKVVPVFAEMFNSFGAELPLPTQVVVSMSEWMQRNWYIGLGVIIVSTFLFSTAMKRSIKFRHGVQRFLLRLPVFGPIFKQSAYARYARTLSTTFAAGVPLVDALDSAAGASGNIVYETAIQNVKHEVSSGGELAGSMRAENVFPPMLVQMVSIGEQSGALDDMLAKAAAIYEEEVDTMVDGLTSMMEPMIMAFLGVVVGGLVVSMYLPIFQIGNVV